MTDLTIRYPTGIMTFHVQEFFPCTITDARKAFPFINEWISEEDFNDLWDTLSAMYAHYYREAMKYQELMNAESWAKNKRKEKEFLAEYRKNETLRKRCKRNIELLIGGCRL